MEERKKDDVQKTQIISPGALGEEANRKKNEVVSGKENTTIDAAQQEGLNEEKSAGSAGAFEGFENTKR
jgi:hypothetical protein